MISNFIWIFLLILQCGIVTPRSTLSQREKDDSIHPKYNYEAQNKPIDENSNEEKVISVRITSSIAVGRSKPKAFSKPDKVNNSVRVNLAPTPDATTTTKNAADIVTTEIPPNLIGANIEFIRQLNAKKDARSHLNGHVHPLQQSGQNYNESQNSSEKSSNVDGLDDSVQQFNQNDDSVAEPSVKTVLGIEEKILNYENINNLALVKTMSQLVPHIQAEMEEKGRNLSATYTEDLEPGYNDTDDTVAASSYQSISTLSSKNESDENIENVPLARSLPFSPSSKNYIQGLTNKPPGERGNSPSLTTVSFNIVHDTPKQSTDYNAQSNIYTNANQGFDNTNKFYEPPKVYSQPAKIYSEPAKFYSEPAKVYSEPAKVYSEPAKVYSEPAKIYSEPAKFYSPPASLHLTPEVVPNYTPWQDATQHTSLTSTVITTTPTALNTILPELANMPQLMQQPEKNYEVDEKVSVLTEGRSHGVQETTTEKCKQDNCKVGYVVEGRQYKKYRVEERTPDGFIVGEYGVVRNEDGALRGVRYTADSDASPRLIYDALMKFLQLK